MSAPFSSELPKDLSLLEEIDLATEAGVYGVGYDKNNPPRPVRFKVPGSVDGPSSAEGQAKPRAVSANSQANTDDFIVVVASATITDPAVPSEGRGFTVLVRNGTATVGGTAYAIAGTVIRRIWHSGSYTNYVDRGALSASEAAPGVVELATAAEAITGTDTTRPPHAAAARAALLAYVDPIALTRQPSSYFQNDGATPNRGIVYSNATRQNIAGLPLWSAAVETLVPSASSTAEVWGQAPLATATALSQAWAHVLAWSGNDLIYQQNGATPATDFRRITWSGLRTTYAGLRVRLLLDVTQGTATAPVLRIANATVTGSATDGAGTDPDWLSSSGSYAAGVSGFNYAAQEHPFVVPIIGALSTAERAEYFATGRLPAWVHAGGSAVAVYTSNFSAGADSWTGSGTTVAGNVDGINGQDDWLSAQRTATTGQIVISRTTTGFNNMAVLQRVTMRARIWNPSATTRYFGFGFGGFAANQAAGESPPVAIPAGTQVDVVWTRWLRADEPLINTGLRILSVSAAGTDDVTIPTGDIFYFKNISFQVGGATTLPGVQGIGTARDLTTLGGTQPNQGRLVGVRPVLTGPAPRNIAIFPLSTTGAFLTLASTNPLALTPQRIMRAEVVVDTAGADLTLKNNQSGAGADIVTALTDIPSANTATALTLIAAQTRLAAGATVWASLSAGTGFIIIETADTL